MLSMLPESPLMSEVRGIKPLSYLWDSLFCLVQGDRSYVIVGHHLKDRYSFKETATQRRFKIYLVR